MTNPENLKKRAEQKGYGFPYLVDESQEIAKAYGAVCTPEFYVYGPERKLAYHGRLDDNWKEGAKCEEAKNCERPSTYCSPVAKRLPPPRCPPWDAP